MEQISSNLTEIKPVSELITAVTNYRVPTDVNIGQTDINQERSCEIKEFDHVMRIQISPGGDPADSCNTL